MCIILPECGKRLWQMMLNHKRYNGPGGDIFPGRVIEG